MRLTGLATVCGLAALAACATTPNRNNSQEPIHALLSGDALMFVSFDTNGDLVVSHDEMEAGITREFQRADTNHDGELQPIEFQNWANSVLGGPQVGPYRLDFDRNVDNVITREEFQHEIEARFGDYDADDSQTLTRSEFVRLVGRAAPPRRANPMEPQPGG
jgi:hypothetical protein